MRPTNPHGAAVIHRASTHGCRSPWAYKQCQPSSRALVFDAYSAVTVEVLCPHAGIRRGHNQHRQRMSPLAVVFEPPDSPAAAAAAAGAAGKIGESENEAVNSVGKKHRSSGNLNRSTSWNNLRQRFPSRSKMTSVPLITTSLTTPSPIPISVSDVDVELDLPASQFETLEGLSLPLSQGLSSSASSLNRLCVPGQGLSSSAPGSPRERKLSLPSTLHQRRPSLSGYAAAAEHARESARLRKLSSVGASMSHRLSSTIGWKPAVVTAAEVTEQAKALCGRYLRAKLRSCGPMHKKLGLQRLKSVSNMCSGYPTTDVSTKLRLICQELERTHPETFQTVVGNIGVHSLPSDSAVQTIFQCVARELFRNDISWGRIAALYSLSGGLAIDCVKLGHPEYIMTIVNSLALFVERDLAQWIAQQGGWGSLITRFKSESSRSRLLEVGLLCVIVILVLIAVRHVILR